MFNFINFISLIKLIKLYLFDICTFIFIDILYLEKFINKFNDPLSVTYHLIADIIDFSRERRG